MLVRKYALISGYALVNQTLRYTSRETSEETIILCDLNIIVNAKRSLPLLLTSLYILG